MIGDNNNSYACEPGFGEKNKVYVANFACCLIQAYNIYTLLQSLCSFDLKNVGPY